MLTTQPLPWMDPLSAAQSVSESHWALLYSPPPYGRYSFLAHHLLEAIESDNFAALTQRLSQKQPCFHERWFGYLGYDLKNSLERLLPQAPHRFGLPNLLMMRFAHVYVFDHQQQSLTRYSHLPSEPALTPQRVTPYSPSAIADLRSNMSRTDYLSRVRMITQEIAQGQLYQANLTRKFMGQWEKAPDSFTIFCELRRISPAAYSAYLQMGDVCVISSSPELFLKIDSSGLMKSEPIKGSARRSPDAADDEASRHKLLHSEKDRAENLMIVDLMRHDFSRSCALGSVQVDSLYSLTTHPTIHHLSSHIRGQITPPNSSLDAISACFPPGSMTGAPKIKAMNLCTMLERDARGIYSGALGWLDGDGSAELSVVIRTLITRGKDFEFQVGGGIVADSEPEAEWDESLAKARAIAQTLGIKEEDLAAL